MNSVFASTLPPWLRRVRNAAVALLALVVIFALIGFPVVPPVAKSQIERRASEGVGRQVTLGKVAFNPFTLKATLTSLTIADHEPGPPLFAFDALDLDLSAASLWHRAPVFDALR